MDEKTALHTAARRFCEEQHSHWATQYMELEQTANSRGSRPFSADWKYSDESYRLFPRYRLDEAILVELERLTPATLGAPRTAVVEAGQRALSRLTFEFKEKPVARLALENEFAAYRSFIKSQSTSELDAVSPLPYRRVLKPEESESTWTLLKGRWGVEGRGVYWYPIGTADPPLGAIAFHQELWDTRNGHELLLRFLRQNVIDRCFLLQEIEAVDYEIDVNLIKSRYMGDEAFLTSDGDWLLYISHESSLTLAGSLATFFQNEWTDFERLSYGGPFHTNDLRGTWKFPDAKNA
ncbi:MAG TPA: hypothetical protein VIW67_25855 [Terriglobales bacterium]|jgi:hypothetical protein